MRARDLARPYPVVTVDDDAQEAARLLARERLPALLVVDQEGYPYAIVPAAQVLRALVPQYVLDDPILAAVVDDRFDDESREAVGGRSVAEWLPRGRLTPGVVGPDVSPMHIAALMARKDCPVVAVIERDGGKATLIGAVTADTLLDHFIGGS